MFFCKIPLWPALAISALSLAIMARMLATSDVIVFREPLMWGFVNWAHRFPFLLEQFRGVFLHGTPYPRWLPELMGGNGYPTFLFYQPGAFFFSLPFALLVTDTVLATKLALLGMLVLGGAGAYRLAGLFASRTGATAAAILYLLNPYLIANLYIRAAYSELFGMVLCPWCGYFAFRLYRQWQEQGMRLRTALGFTLSLAALGASHPFVSLYFAPVMILLAIGMWVDGGRKAWRLMLMFALCGAGAFVLASPYLLTVLQMREEINYQGIQFAFLKFLMPVSDVIGANLLSTLLAAIGLWSIRRSAIAWAIMAGWAGLVFVQSVHAYSLWEHFTPLRMTQLPYRTLTSDAFLRLLAGALAFGYLERKLPVRGHMKLAAPAMAAAACLVSAAWNPIAIPPTRAPFSWAELQGRLQDSSHAAFKQAMGRRYDDQSLHYDFIPRRVNLEQLAKEAPFSRPLAWTDGAAPLTLHNLEGYPPYDIRFRVTVPDSPGLAAHPAMLHIRQFYFTGWRVRVDGKAQEPGALPPGGGGSAWQWGPGDDARLQVNFHRPGDYLIEADYEGPPYWLARNMIILLLLAAITASMRRLLRP